MFRTLLLASIAPLVIACQSSQPMMDQETAVAPMEEQVIEPTDGLDNEIGVNND